MGYLMDNAPVLALFLDSDLRITSANAHARRVLGEHLVGQALSWFIVDFSRNIDLAAITAQRSGIQMLAMNTTAKVPETFYFRFFTVEGGTLALGSLNVQEQERLQIEVLSLNRNLNNLTRQLHQANADLVELNKMKNQFLGMAAHDLRQPLGVIMVFTQYIIDEAGSHLNAEHQGFLLSCIRAANDMKRLIDDFLDVSMIESGRLRLELAPARAGDIIGPVVMMGRLLAANKSVNLISNPGDSQRSLLVDSAKLQQVLLNLVGNAISHSAGAQRVWLTARWEPESLVLSVRDEGPGIPQEQQQRLFAPFERLASRRTAGERHAGLGLAIAQKIVEAHEGEIRVESTLGKGSTFIVTIPANLKPHPVESADG